MPDITQRNWPLGWIPSDNFVGGRLEGALRFDNLMLDKRGIVSLANGCTKIQDATGNPTSIFSKFIGPVRNILYHSGSSVYANDEELFATGGDQACYGNAFDYILISSGDTRIKWNGTVQYNLGLKPPSKPEVEEAQNANVVVSTPSRDISVLKGTLVEVFPGTDQAVITSESDGILAILGNGLGAYNPFKIDGADGTDNDKFFFAVRLGHSDLYKKIQVAFCLDDDLDTSVNYYMKEFSNEIIPSDFNQGEDIWTGLTCKRSDFARFGDDSEKNWNNCHGVRLIVQTTGVDTFVCTSFIFFGGEQSSLDGRYKYYQVNVHNSTYQGKSAPSPISDLILVYNGKVKVTPSIPDDDQVNEIWIYRVSDETSTDVTRIGDEPKLAFPYRVKVLDKEADGFGAFLDEVSDKDALFEAEILDPSLASIVDIADEIIGIGTPVVKTRVAYLTEKEVVLSNLGDLDSYNPNHIIKLSGSTTEKNLWITVGRDSFVIGTTEDIYEISGSFEELLDGSMSRSIQPLGLGRACPISKQFHNDGGSIYYFSADGWRQLSGASFNLIVGELDLLFRGEPRHGIDAVAIKAKGTGNYPVAYYSEQLWTFQDLLSGERVGFVLDKELGWRFIRLNVTCVCVSEDGMLIAGMNGKIVRLDSGNDFDGQAQAIQFVTALNDGQLPRNRKDLYTLKLSAYTGADQVAIMLAIDGENWINLGTYGFSSDVTERIIDLTPFAPLGKRVALQIQGVVSRFELYSYTIEFGKRPEQLTHMRIESTNMGTLARKRWTSYGLVVDTLGAQILFTPLVDNVAKTGSQINHAEKLTHVHYFPEETIGTDISGVLSTIGNTPFEFYGLNLEETVSEKLPTPTTFLVIPQDDYGNPNRKRHSSYKFQINTRGADVEFTPKLDGLEYTPATYNTTEKRTVEYFFQDDTIAIDIGGKIASIGVVPFEFYGVIKPQDIEVLPPRLKEKYVAENNLGIAARKRLRTLPLEINTNGHNVVFTPIFDGIPGESAIFNTPKRKTVLWYATTDVFCIDVACNMVGEEAFEFYQLLKPEEVEILPVAKKFDQLGPWQIDKIGKLYSFRVRCLFDETTIPYTIYAEDEIAYQGTFNARAGIDSVWEVSQLPATIQGTVFRLEIGPTVNPFHRWDVWIRTTASGMDTDNKWLKLK